MNIVPYDDDRHRAFVLPTFSMQAGLPGATVDRLRRAGAHIVVGESPGSLKPGELCKHCGHYDTLRCSVTGEEHVLLYGWGGTYHGSLIWCFVKMKLAEMKLDPRIMAALGIDTKKRIPALFTGSPLRAMSRRYGWQFQWQQDRAQDALRATA